MPALLLALLPLAGCAGPGGGISAGAAGGDTAVQGVRGKLVHEGKPLAAAYVYAYRSYSTNLLGPADFASEPSAHDGSYALDLVEGSYHLVARKKASGLNTGPIVVGDLYSVHRSNPVAVKRGKFTVVELDLVLMRDPMFFQAVSRKESSTGVKGRIVDVDGKPVPWVFAMAYRNSDMKRVPDFTSIMTAADGTFIIFLPSGGRYWLAARKKIREKPVEGEPYGLYRGTPDHSIDVPEGGFVEGVFIELEEYRKGIQD